MNAETENRTEGDSSVDSEFDPPTEAENRSAADADAAPSVDADERRIIGDAIARGYQVTRWTAMVIGLLFIASGLWWAGILVIIVTTLDLPRVVTQRYARKRGIRLDVPSIDDVEKRNITGLLLGAVFLPAVCGLIVAEAKLGHPLLPWSWKNRPYDESDLYMLWGFGAAGVVIIIGWFVRRRRASRPNRDEFGSRGGHE
ncbi:MULTISPECIES: hypothetical protein [unclassified Brevibacterium]|uniref:hypothetical protein n=1 Tax=unclassified Brevibacterium TaxID=2614124 RepID=UPI0010931413|nr:hypothetical protein [Brevibacterium sp. S22]TGD31829.1 hypothetical protein EB835_07180 [Brevibacterium sp. S22]